MFNRILKNSRTIFNKNLYFQKIVNNEKRNRTSRNNVARLVPADKPDPLKQN